MRHLAFALAVTVLARADDFHLTPHSIARLHGERISGSAIAGRKLATWGDRLRWWNIPDGKSAVFGPRGTFAEGGAMMDVDGSGRLDWIVDEISSERALVWIESQRGTRHVIDTGVDTADVMPADLFGRRGILVVQRRAQVRFYEIPQHLTGRWPMREIYSFYTPSDQGGLLLADIDGDGRPDILCGNYWIRSPETFELPWRLFAIELWNEQPHSAMLRIAIAGLQGKHVVNLVAVEREMRAGRLAWFEKPADPRELWIEHRLSDGPPLDHPRSLGVADFDGDGRLDVLVAEQGGAGRLVVFHNEGGGRFVAKIIAAAVFAARAHVIDWDGDGRPDILAISERAISWWQNESR